MAKRILKPLSYAGLFDEAFDLYKRHFVLLFGISLVITAPVHFLVYASGYSVFSIQFVTIPMNALQMCAVTYAISRSYIDKAPGLLESYAYVLRKPVAMIATVLITVVFIYIGLLLFLIPGIIFGFRALFVAPVYVLEGVKYFPAIQRSRQLAAGHWGRIFIVVAIGLALTAIIGIILCLPGGLLVQSIFRLSDANTHPLGILNQAVATAATTPIFTIIIVLLYYDIRVRKEGFDIEMLASSMGVAAPQQPVSSYAASSVEPQTHTPSAYNPDTTDPNDNPYQRG